MKGQDENQSGVNCEKLANCAECQTRYVEKVYKVCTRRGKVYRAYAEWKSPQGLYAEWKHKVLVISERE